MKRIRLHQIGNEGNFNYYIFDKKINVMLSLSRIFENVFGEHAIYEDLLYRKGKIRNERVILKELKDYFISGTGFNYNSRIDIFHGDKRIFVVIHCSQKLRLKFNEDIIKISYMSKDLKTRGKKR